MKFSPSNHHDREELMKAVTARVPLRLVDLPQCRGESCGQGDRPCREGCFDEMACADPDDGPQREPLLTPPAVVTLIALACIGAGLLLAWMSPALPI